jgi:hypothetical protein
MKFYCIFDIRVGGLHVLAPLPLRDFVFPLLDRGRSFLNRPGRAARNFQRVISGQRAKTLGNAPTPRIPNATVKSNSRPPSREIARMMPSAAML